MSPHEEIAAAVKALSDAADDVTIYAQFWDSTSNLPYLPMPVRTFIRAMSPVVGRELADLLSGWEGHEFSEHNAMPDDLAAALAIARAINRSAS